MKAVFALAAVASAQDLFLANKAPHTASTSDLRRAKTTEHSGHVSGRSTTEIATKINKHLEAQKLNLKECADMSHEELDKLVRSMWPLLSQELQQTYAGQDLRQLAHKTLEGFETRWANEALHVMHPESGPALRDAKCAEVLMMWSHHVSEAGKKALRDLVLPTLAEFNMDHIEKRHHEVADRYASSFTCVTGHNAQSGHTSDHVFPHWPEEAHYEGKGHGAYPFWAGPGGQGSSAAIEVYWSEKQLSERFYHASCSMSEVGYSGGTTDCYHLFVGGQPSPSAYLYTAKKDFCCKSGPGSTSLTRSFRNVTFPPTSTEKLAAPSSDFMDSMTLTGTGTGTYDFYSGSVKKYLLQLPSTEAVTYFWYVTTAEGKPVEQGEGGKSSSEPAGGGIQIWHDYNTDTFKSTTIDSSIFEVPAICKTTSTTCTFP